MTADSDFPSIAGLSSAATSDLADSGLLQGSLITLLLSGSLRPNNSCQSRFV
jgi:hypothetical protein